MITMYSAFDAQGTRVCILLSVAGRHIPLAGNLGRLGCTTHNIASQPTGYWLQDGFETVDSVPEWKRVVKEGWRAVRFQRAILK